MKKVFMFVMVALLLSGCADYVTLDQAAKLTQVGFWHGLWHGLILPFAFLISIFDDSVTVYAIYNNGIWYNWGFVMGACIIFGSSAKST